MYAKILATGVTTAAILGAGTGAVAVSGTGETSGSGSTSTASAHHRPAKALLRHGVHGQIVTHGDDGYVRHDGVVGTVTAVSAWSITVRAVDGYRETFTVADRTVVRKRADGAKSRSAITAVHTGDQVAVVGRTTDGANGTATARLIVDGVKR